MTSSGEKVKVAGKEHRIFGPPGTGKTTRLTGHIRATVRDRGPEAVVVASFTKAAAVEIAGRKLPVPKDNVGTLHALCYRALGRPRIAESKESLKDWNARCDAAWRVQEVDKDDLLPGERDVDSRGLYQAYCLARARRVDRRLWGSALLRFAKAWEAFKEDTGAMDFTDLIEQALERGAGLPAGVEVGFFDEAQDFSPLELALVRSWGERLERIILSGDDDQCIYSFKGATPLAFLDPPIPDEQKHYLTESYRVPARVKALADSWIHGVQTRELKEFSARKEADGSTVQGTVDTLPVGFDRAEEVVAEITRHAGKTVMVLATCGYMLDGVIHEFREQGILFHNPYRLKNGKWNPMRGGIDRVLCLLRNDASAWGSDARAWTWAEAWRWLELVDAKRAGLTRGVKAVVQEMAKRAKTRDEELSWPSIQGLFDQATDAGRATLGAIRNGHLLERYQSVLLEKSRPLVRYALNVAVRNGKATLRQEPKVIVGTVHSVKGGEASVVLVSPDLSAAAAGQWTGETGTREDMDSIRRVFYVAFTRARERLVLCEPRRRNAWMRQAVEF